MAEEFKFHGFKNSFSIRAEYDDKRKIWVSHVELEQGRLENGEWETRSMSSTAFDENIDVATELAVMDISKKLRELNFDLFGDGDESNEADSSQNPEDRPIIL